MLSGILNTEKQQGSETCCLVTTDAEETLKDVWLLASGMFIQWPRSDINFRFWGLRRNNVLSRKMKTVKQKMLLPSCTFIFNSLFGYEVVRTTLTQNRGH